MKPLTIKKIETKLREFAQQLDDAWDEDDNFALSENRVEAVYNALRNYACEITEHDFGPDQCGFWHHDYCFKCGSMKHPDISALRCGEFIDKYGKMSEAEWVESKQCLQNTTQ